MDSLTLLQVQFDSLETFVDTQHTEEEIPVETFMDSALVRLDTLEISRPDTAVQGNRGRGRRLRRQFKCVAGCGCQCCPTSGFLFLG